ncbi:hypothetical protein BOX15_Mlig002415g1 [Macrostomum lignano]|uniref:Uncharacterized protein n=1 Tax=Macrostomum lignano TaxID=282301 RepID=A0A267ED32_9PLAT|nr:hypothetical protein BOX15_Mlig002415g1 [Macrostomum lignano]
MASADSTSAEADVSNVEAESKRKAELEAVCVMAAEGSLRELKLKIESGATIDRFMKESIDGRTALHCCAAASVTEVLVSTQLHTRIAEILLQNGADAFARDKDGRSALHLAVMSSNPSLVDLLLTARPGNPNIQDIRRSWTPLMYAAKCKSSTITKLLLKNDARHDIADKDGNTALIIAAENRNTEVFKLLVKRGADLDHRNNSGDSAKSIASDQRWELMKKWIQEYLRLANNQEMADTKRLCRLASKGEHEAMGNLLRNKPSIVSSKYPLYSDRSALLCAAAASKRHYSQGGEDHTKCAEILVRFGADLNGQDSKSNTVLHLSVKSKNDSLLKFLLGKDVRVADKRNSDSSTPLMLAAEFDYEQHAELLLEHGARTGSVDELFYHAAKEIAESEGSERVLEVMRNFDQRQREKEKVRDREYFCGAQVPRFENIFAGIQGCIHQITHEANTIRNSVSHAVQESYEIYMEMPAYFDHNAQPLRNVLTEAERLGNVFHEKCERLSQRWAPVEQKVLQLLGRPQLINKTDVLKSISDLRECIQSADECKHSLSQLKEKLSDAARLSRELAEKCRKESSDVNKRREERNQEIRNQESGTRNQERGIWKQALIAGAVGGAVGGPLGLIAGLWLGSEDAATSATSVSARHVDAQSSNEDRDLDQRRLEALNKCAEQADQLERDLRFSINDLSESTAPNITSKCSEALEVLEQLASKF